MNRLLDFVGSQESFDRLTIRISASVSIFALITAAILVTAALLK